jgi:hypothetical protein
MVSSSTVNSGLSWTRSSTTLTITHTSHGRSNGDRVIVRNANADNFSGIISNVSANTFDVTTTNTGSTSGSAAAYSLGFTSTSITSTSSTITAPSGGDVQLISFLVNDTLAGTYTLTVPTSSTNGAGANNNIYDAYPPLVRVYTTGGATVGGGTLALTSTPNVFVISSTGSGERTVRLSF